MKASDITLDSYISILMKGPYGFGKTLAAASYALAGPTYIAYFDKKKPVELVTYFKQFGDKGKKILDNIEYDIYGSNNAHDYLNRVIAFSKDCRYTTFITDSVTNLTSAAVNWSLGFRKAGGKKDKENKDAPAMIPDFDEYKVETSLVTQALDICKTLPCNVIWIAHPLPVTRVEGSGASMKVTKATNIVTYGSKVGAMVPGNFTEIYHFSKRSSWDTQSGKSIEKFTVDLRGIGDDFAKTALFGMDITELDITNRLFYEVWKEALDLEKPANNPTEVVETTESIVNPFQQTSKWRV